MKKLLEAKEVSVKYPGNKKYSIENISFSLYENSITALIGPNGSGKSTLIKAILGFIDFEGSVRFEEKDIAGKYKEIGYVPQRFAFDTNFPITVHEFLHMSCAKRSFDAEIDNLLKEVNMKGKDNQLLSSLSGGQLQKLLLVRSLLQNPKLLILDEPEAGVDAGSEASFYKLLKKLVDKNKLTVLMATHELDIVSAFASQVICINKTLVCNGSPKNVLSENMFEKLYGYNLKFYGHNHK